VSFLIGLLNVSVQIVMPMAAASATRETKGRMVSIVFTGLLIGVLGARIVSGAVAAWLGWRWVYGLSAILIVSATVLLMATAPKLPSHHTGTYRTLIQSTLHQLARFPELCRIALIGALL
jgi:MFS family permease